MKSIIKYKSVIIGMLIGAMGGYAYYHFVGCVNGTCLISSNPIISTIYGAFMGGLLLSNSKN